MPGVVTPPYSHRCQVACQVCEVVHVAGDEAPPGDEHVHGAQHVCGMHAVVVRVVQVAQLQAAEEAGQAWGGRVLGVFVCSSGGSKRGVV